LERSLIETCSPMIMSSHHFSELENGPK